MRFMGFFLPDLASLPPPTAGGEREREERFLHRGDWKLAEREGGRQTQTTAEEMSSSREKREKETFLRGKEGWEDRRKYRGYLTFLLLF